MRVQVDGRGLTPPTPAQLTKKALEHLVEGSVETFVDSREAMEQVVELCQRLHYHYDVMEIDGLYQISIFKCELNMDNELMAEEKPKIEDLAIFVVHPKIGEEEVLGDVLIRGYFHTLTQRKMLPRALLFANEGVFLTTEGSPVLDSLRKLESMGVEILSCSTSLDYFGRKNRLVVGGASTMVTIVNRMHNVKRTITL
jgi:selenium metabolism protein YedF